MRKVLGLRWQEKGEKRIYERSTKHMAADWKVGSTKYRVAGGIVPVVCVSGSDR